MIQIPQKQSVKCAEQVINNVIILKHILHLVTPLMEVMENVKSDSLVQILRVYIFTSLIPQFLDTCCMSSIGLIAAH